MTPRTKAGAAHWRRIRKEVLDRCGGVCERCHEAPAWQVHHLTYARFNKEKPGDLLALCGRCHLVIHRRHAGAKPTVPRRHAMSRTVADARRAATRARKMLRAARRQGPPLDPRRPLL